MARKDNKNARPDRLADSRSESAGAERPGSVRRKLAAAAVTVVLLAATVFALKAMELRVLRGGFAGPTMPVEVVLVDRPVWMPAAVAAQIAKSITPPGADYHDPRLTKEIYSLAEANAWIRRVRRVSKHKIAGRPAGLVRISAEFRKPLARVSVSAGRFIYVDAEGVRLPARQVGQWVVSIPGRNGSPARQVCYLRRADVRPGLRADRIHYIVISGVDPAGGDAPNAGRRWQADDLADGLKLVGLIYTRPYANQITVVDVSNHRGRNDPSGPGLLMYAQMRRGRATQIRWGRFPAGPGDYNVSPERKMSYLDKYYADHGRLAGLHSYLDLRYDNLHVSIY